MNTPEHPTKKHVPLIILIALILLVLLSPIPRVYKHTVYCAPCVGEKCAPCPTQGDIYWDRSIAHQLYLHFTYDAGGATETFRVE